MTLHILSILVVLFGCTCAVPVDVTADDKPAPQAAQENDDLKPDASTYVRRYDWAGAGGYPNNNYNYVTGYGLLDDKYNTGYNGGYNGYNGGYSGYSGYSGYAGAGGSGYGYKGYGGYDNGVGYGQNALGGGNGGYGGYGGNGGLTSYYGYNNPYYPGGQHLGYSYRKPGYGSIYNSGITPSLVTGYRGYSRR